MSHQYNKSFTGLFPSGGVGGGGNTIINNTLTSLNKTIQYAYPANAADHIVAIVETGADTGSYFLYVYGFVIRDSNIIEITQTACVTASAMSLPFAQTESNVLLLSRVGNKVTVTLLGDVGNTQYYNLTIKVQKITLQSYTLTIAAETGKVITDAF